MFLTRYFLFAVCVAVLTAHAVADDSADQSKREQQLIETLSGAVLVGTFSVDGVELGKSPFPERYELKSVEKTEDGLWTFTARVTYLKQDLTIPITVPIVWAGDTPMISLTDGTLPGLGSALSARVIFHEGRYAGTWKHGKFGGHMWGKIERGITSATEPDASQAEPVGKPPTKQ